MKSERGGSLFPVPVAPLFPASVVVLYYVYYVDMVDQKRPTNPNIFSPFLLR